MPEDAHERKTNAAVSINAQLLIFQLLLVSVGPSYRIAYICG